MKKYNILTITSLLLVLSSCVTDKKNLFSIDDSKFKVMYHSGDPISLTVINKKDKTIDSVAYYKNDQRIGSSKGNTEFKYVLSDPKLGQQNLKAIVYYEGDKFETSAQIEVVANAEPKELSYTIVNEYPHDTKAFTEGLEFHDGFLYESTGKNGESNFRKVAYKTGKIEQQVNLDAKYFGEGITFINGKLFQLTWQENTGFIYDAKTLKLEKNFTYDKKIEGWGLTNDGKYIFQSDGSEKIWKMDPATQKMIENINVYTNSSKITSVNELEWIEGKIYANIWQKDGVAVINPNTGAVEAFLDLSALRKKTNATEEDVLNGIAYNPVTKTIFVTGKNWNKVFEIAVK